MGSVEGCIFCAVPPNRIVTANDSAIAIRDAFPVSPGHTLIIPRRHIPDWWSTTGEERAAIDALLREAQTALQQELDPDGFNIGVNNGAAAGQTVFHLHVHLIPRFDGDTPNPRGGVRHVIPDKGDYLAPDSPAELALRSHLHDGPERALAPALADAIEREGVTAADLVVSFVMVSGLEILLPQLERVLDAGGRVRLLTSDYLGVTEKDALAQLLRMSEEYGTRLQVRVYLTQGRSFHPKSYLLGTSGGGVRVAFTGSANISRPGLLEGIEWSVETRDTAGLSGLARAFEGLWDDPSSRLLSEELVADYREAPRPAGSAAVVVEPPSQAVAPTAIQREALAALEHSRADGFGAGLVAMATGLGKTWLAAFDSTRPAYRRVLFVAHREEILRQARAVFRRVRPDASVGLIMGPHHQADADVVMATVQSLSGRLADIDPAAFDYIVVDEFHHAAARTYRQVVNHFDSKFLLGLTATPDRTDGADLLSLCEDNLVFECGLTEGIARGLLSPFRYHGVPDPVDFEPLPWRNKRFDPDALEHAVVTGDRIEAAHREWTERAGERTLAFCVSVRHADVMAQAFRDRGVTAVAVHSGPTSAPRHQALADLAEGHLQVVFSVDMFNEGVDVPAVDTVLMLRPTESSIVFLQQVGRGLRKHRGKDRLNVIDFVGNHRSFLLPARILAGLTGSASDEAVRRLAAGELELPPGCEVDYELQARENLLELLPRRRGEAVAGFVAAWIAEHGSRPTANQVFRSGINPASATPHWHAFLADRGFLPDAEAEVVRRHDAVLSYVARTSMTKSYKMVALRAFTSPESLVAGMDVAELVAVSRRLALRDPRLLADVTNREMADPRSASIEAWQRRWRQFPLDVMVDNRQFRIRENRFTVRDRVDPADASLLADMIQELVDWRLSRYLEPSSDRSVVKVIRAGEQPILMLQRDRNPLLPEGRGVSVLADGERYTFDFMKVAVNVARRSGEGPNVLGELLREWFGESAGAPGTEHRVELWREGNAWHAAAVERGIAGEVATGSPIR